MWMCRSPAPFMIDRKQTCLYFSCMNRNAKTAEMTNACIITSYTHLSSGTDTQHTLAHFMAHQALIIKNKKKTCRVTGRVAIIHLLSHEGDFYFLQTAKICGRSVCEERKSFDLLCNTLPVTLLMLWYGKLYLRCANVFLCCTKTDANFFFQPECVQEKKNKKQPNVYLQQVLSKLTSICKSFHLLFSFNLSCCLRTSKLWV